MKNNDRRRVSSVLERNTKRIPIEELAARGRRHVRVISGERALELLEAVVDDVIARRSGEIAAADRERIVAEAETDFRRAASIHAEAQDLIEQQKAMIAELHRERDQLVQRDHELVGALRRREKRLQNMRQTILAYDGEIDRLAKIAGEREGQVARLEKLLEELSRRDDDGGERLLQQLAARDQQSTAALEARFRNAMGETLEQIRRTLHSATSGPIDNPIEATDAMVAKIFDEAGEMDSNLGRLDVATSPSQGITDSLARLKAMRARALGEDDDDTDGTHEKNPNETNQEEAAS